MPTNSRDIKRRLEREGWQLERVQGSHHVFKHVRRARRHIQASKLGKRLSVAMPHYVAIIEESDSERAVGVWVPDLPGCFSAGDDLDEALRNAPEAISLYADSLAEEGRRLPSPRSLTKLRRDPVVAEDLKNYMVALVTAPDLVPAAQ